MRLAKTLCLLSLLCATVFASAQLAIPSLTQRVTDMTATLLPEQKAQLEQSLQAFEAKKGSQIGVLIVPTTAPEAIEQYSLRVVEQWKFGRKKIDDGALLIIAKDDRALRIEVGYGLEGALNDAVSKRIISDIITPKFKAGDFYGGISDGLEGMMRIIDGEPLPQAQRAGGGGALEFESYIPIILIAALVMGGIFRALLGRFPGAVVTGGLMALLAWAFLGVLSMALLAGGLAFMFTLFGGGARGFRGGHYGGGFGGASGGFGGGGSGGFSGGGGGFGGGGASGKW